MVSFSNNTKVINYELTQQERAYKKYAPKRSHVNNNRNISKLLYSYMPSFEEYCKKKYKLTEYIKPNDKYMIYSCSNVKIYYRMFVNEHNRVIVNIDFKHGNTHRFYRKIVKKSDTTKTEYSARRFVIETTRKILTALEIS